MTGENKRANIASELGRADESMRAARVQTGRMDPQDARLFARIQKYRLEADYGRDFVLTDAALREDLASCQGFLDRATGGSDGGCKSLRPADVSFGLSPSGRR